MGGLCITIDDVLRRMDLMRLLSFNVDSTFDHLQWNCWHCMFHSIFCTTQEICLH